MAEEDLSASVRMMAPGTGAETTAPGADLGASVRSVSGQLPPMGETELERRMTPGPKKPILDTSFHSIPTKDGGVAMPWDNWQPPTFAGVPSRVAQEAVDAYRNTPTPFSPGQRQAVENTGWLGRYGLSPAMWAANQVVKGVPALAAGGMAGVSELAAGGDPQMARDIHAGLSIAPVLRTMVPPGVNVPMPASEQFGPMPNPRVPIGTVKQAEPWVDAAYKAADASGVTPPLSLTEGFLDDLKAFRKQTPEGIATNGPNAVTTLVDRLQNLENQPITSMAGIKEIDRMLQAEIDGQFGPNGNATYRRDMKQILNKFRDRTDNLDPTLKPARDAYAAQQRIKEVEQIGRDADLYDNPATRIRTGIRAFLRDEDNTRGWTQAEKDSLRRAGDSGFLTEWLRTEGSRILGIGSALSGDLTTRLVATPAQVATSYFMRNQLENLRQRKLQETQTLLGQRIPQPGRVAIPPPARQLPPLISTTARYTPLLGQLSEQNQ